MLTNIDLLDSIVICKGGYGYYAYLRFKDSYYNRDIGNQNLEVVYQQIQSYLFKTFRTVGY